MNNVYIIGDGGFAKEVFYLLEETNFDYDKFSGFIGYEPKSDVVEIGTEKHCVVNEDKFLSDNKNADNIFLFIGIGDPTRLSMIKKKYVGFNFPNLVHRNLGAHHKSLAMGKGNIVASGCNFTVDIRIGSFNIFNLNSTIGHDATIGNCNVINPGVNISGSVSISDNNLIGTNAAILQGIMIGSNNKIGAGSMINRNIEDGLTVVGVPGKPLERKV